MIESHSIHKYIVAKLRDRCKLLLTTTNCPGLFLNCWPPEKKFTAMRISEQLVLSNGYGPHSTGSGGVGGEDAGCVREERCLQEDFMRVSAAGIPDCPVKCHV